MSIHVKVRSNYFNQQLDVWIARDIYPAGYEIYYPALDNLGSFDTGTWVQIDQYHELPTEPSLKLPDGAGRSLMEELITHYKGSENTQALRKDYDAERARVDTLIQGLLKGNN
jgi:hypothetical protein